jgi:glycosyltransferase involved in cell wall biosynthesis
MRVLYVCSDPGISPLGEGGTAAHLRALSAAMVRRGHAVTIACRRTDGDNRLAPGVAVAVMPEGWSAQAGWLLDQMRRTGSDVVVERYSLRSGPAVDARHEWPIALLLEVDAPLVEEALRSGVIDDADAWRRWEARLFADVDHVVAVSEVVSWHVLATGVPRDRVSVVPNGVDPMRFAGVQGHSVRLQYDLGHRFVAGYCGTLDSWHGVEDLVEAAAMLPRDTRVLIVGDGPNREQVQQCAVDFGVDDRVVMTGAVPETEVPHHLAAMDVGVAPYNAVERFYLSPLKVLEYCAAGLPMVATAQGELTRLGGAATLVPPADPAALAAALAGLAEDPARRQFMARAARAHANERTWDRAAQKLEEVLGLTRLDARSEVLR